MHIIKIENKYLSQIFPKIRLVDYREEVTKQGLFAEHSEAIGVINVLRFSPRFKNRMIDIIEFSNASQKYASCYFDVNKSIDKSSWIASNRHECCDSCKMVLPSVKLLKVSKHKTFFICPFCIQRFNDEATSIIDKLDEAIKNDYYSSLLCNNLSDNSDEFEDSSEFDVPF